MFITKLTKFKCPNCGYEYERIVGSGCTYEYQGKEYESEICAKCNKKFLYNKKEFIKIPNESKLKYRGYWMS